MNRRALRYTSLSMALVATAIAAAPQQACAQALPAADQVIARFVQAMGGRDLILSQKTSRATGTFELPSAGLKADIEVVTEAPNRMGSKVTIPGLGEMRTGYDGTIGWSVDPMSGARVMQGSELDAIREQSNSLAAIRDASLFKSMETVERTEVGGQPCFKVKLVWQSGRETADCYHAESGLLIASWSQTESPMGTVDVVTRIEEYGEFGGIKTPIRTVQEAMGMQQVFTVSAVEYGNVDTSLIEPPAEIKALAASPR